MTAAAGIRMKSPTHAGGFVKHEIIEPHGLSVTNAARILGVTRPALSALLEERATLSPGMALRLKKKPLASQWTTSCQCKKATTSPKPESGRRDQRRPLRWYSAADAGLSDASLVKMGAIPRSRSIKSIFLKLSNIGESLHEFN